jgi:phage-related tail fiber protein
MSNYNTGNLVPSTDPRDIDDNATVFDRLVNGAAASYLDRLGAPRKSWRQMEIDAGALVSPNVAALAGLLGVADRGFYFTGSSALSMYTLSALGRTLGGIANAAAGRTAIGAASLGANSDITSLTGLTTALSAAQGGTGNTNGTAAYLTTARNIAITGDGTYTVSFNGAVDVSAAFTLASVGVAGTYGQVTTDAKGRVTAGTVVTPLANGGTGNTTGLAATATALATSRSISTTGDATWTVSFNGTANVTAALTLAASGVGAGTYGSVTVNAKGLVTAASIATPVANGGTGATTAGAALTALGAASSGANGDITSLTGLTTALSLAQGGTGAAPQAYTNFTLQNSWTVTASRRAAYRKVLDMVHIEMSVGGGTSTDGTTIATLPAGFRPPFQMVFPASAFPTVSSTSAIVPSITVGTDGTIKCNNCATTLIAFCVMIPTI